MKTAASLRLSLGLASLLAAGGCVSGTDIEGIHRHLAEVDKKVDAASKQSSSKEEVAKLSDAIQKQAQTILRSNADLGTRFDELIREMQTLAGKLEDANRRLSQLSQQIASAGLAAQAVPPSAPPSSPVGSVGSAGAIGSSAGSAPTAPPSGLATSPRGPSPADLFAQATADYQRGQYELARQGFQEYLETYPKTDLSDDAAYWMGECYSALKKPADAITAFDRLLKLFPQSDKAAAAYLKKALAHLELGQKREAIVQLQWVVHEYSGSDEAKSARQRLKALGSDSR